MLALNVCAGIGKVSFRENKKSNFKTCRFENGSSEWQRTLVLSFPDPCSAVQEHTFCKESYVSRGHNTFKVFP